MSIKLVVCLMLTISLFGLLFSLPINESQTHINSDFLRIHIRANSNDDVDQNVKYKVKDAVVAYLTPILSDVYDKQSAINLVYGNLSEIEKVCNDVLLQEGFNYKSEADIKTENFPTRTYNQLTLPEGVYDSLIINLGTGCGNNWWCVVYPPLCFVSGGTDNVTYRSKILEIIDSFRRGLCLRSLL